MTQERNLKDNNKALLDELHEAARSGDVKKVKKLIASGILKDKWTAWHFAAVYSYIDLLKALDNYNEINFQTNNGCTALYFAARNGKLKVVDLLIKAQAKLNIQNIKGFTALHVAAEKGYAGVAGAIIKAAEENAKLDIQKTEGAPPPLPGATQQEYIEVVKALLNIQNVEGVTPLYLAAQYGHIEVLETLILAKADFRISQAKGFTALHVAAENGQVEVIKALIKAAKANAKPDIQNEESVTPLPGTTQQEYIEVVKALLNIQNTEGITSLHLAAEKGHVKIVDALLLAGAALHIPTNEGCTALYIAACHGHVEVVKTLINAGAKATLYIHNAPDGTTPLQIAAYQGHIEVVKVLINAGADIHIKNEVDYTALHGAIFKGHKEVAVELVKAGAKMDVQNEDLETPLSLLYGKEWGAEVIAYWLANGHDVKKLDPAFIATYPELQSLWIKALKEKCENLINEYKAQVALPHTAYSMFIEQKIQKDALPCAVPTLQEICMQKLLQNPEQVLKKYTMNRDFGLPAEAAPDLMGEEVRMTVEE